MNPEPEEEEVKKKWKKKQKRVIISGSVPVPDVGQRLSGGGTIAAPSGSAPTRNVVGAQWIIWMPGFVGIQNSENPQGV